MERSLPPEARDDGCTQVVGGDRYSWDHVWRILASWGRPVDQGVWQFLLDGFSVDAVVDVLREWTDEMPPRPGDVKARLATAPPQVPAVTDRVRAVGEWKRLVNQLVFHFGESVRAGLEPVVALGYSGDVLVLGVRHGLAQWVDERYGRVVRQSLVGECLFVDGLTNEEAA